MNLYVRMTSKITRRNTTTTDFEKKGWNGIKLITIFFACYLCKQNWMAQQLFLNNLQLQLQQQQEQQQQPQLQKQKSHEDLPNLHSIPDASLLLGDKDSRSRSVQMFSNGSEFPDKITVREDLSPPQNLPRHESSLNRKYARVLTGIFSADLNVDEVRSRMAVRDLFSLYHPRICSLYDFLHMKTSTNATNQEIECELIYTFVLGGNQSTDALTSIVDEKHYKLSSMTIHFSAIKPKYASDYDNPDMTYLNIRENMNDGKSQTWLYYASTHANLLGIEYVMKMDTDTVLYLDRFFSFLRSTLPPAPYHEGIIAGQPFSKSRWKMTQKEIAQQETHFKRTYSGTHIYAAGQLYILSYDIAAGIANYYSTNPKTVAKYSAVHEDHDISMVAFLQQDTNAKKRDRPIKFVMVRDDDPFWAHTRSTKIRLGVTPWKKLWSNELQRIKNLTSEHQSQFEQRSTQHGFQSDSIIKHDTDGTKQSTTDNQDKQKNSIMITQFNETHQPIEDERAMTHNIFSSYFRKLQQSLYSSDLRNVRKNATHSNNSNVIDDGAEFDQTIHELLSRVEIDNTISINNSSCFLKSGHLNSHLKVVQFNGGGNDDKNDQDTLTMNTINHPKRNDKTYHDGKYWWKLAHFISSKVELDQTDVVVLNGMIDEVPNNSIHSNESDSRTIIQRIAIDLGMNFAWAIEYIHFSNDTMTSFKDVDRLSETLSSSNTDNTNNVLTKNMKQEQLAAISIHGTAVLSKCKLYDPLLIRHNNANEHLQAHQSISQEQELLKENTFEKHQTPNIRSRYGSPLALFVRTGNDDAILMNNQQKRRSLIEKRGTSHRSDMNNNHIVLGTVSQLQPTPKQIVDIWEYQFYHQPGINSTIKIDEGDTERPTLMGGTPPHDQIGSIVAGHMNRNICNQIGLLNMDSEHKRKTYPATCDDTVHITKRYGTVREDNFCGNIPYKSGTQDIILLPCTVLNPDMDHGFNKDTISKTDIQSNEKLQISPTQFSNHAIIAVSVF